jgi:tetratricopeptide (TPR) repeat protein
LDSRDSSGSLDPTEARAHQEFFDQLWDFADPTASELRLRAAADDPANAEIRALLLTQVARALGLGGKFDEARALLDEVEAAATSDPETAIRALLERGRVLNSNGSPSDARPLFEAAFQRASAVGFEHLAIDAMHMVAIVAAPEEQVALNEQALSLARGASDPRARGWRASLLNNLGWTRFNAGELDAALALFGEAVEERVSMGKEREIGLARWSVARTYRALGRYSDALEAQLALASWLGARAMPDSFVDEEIGECLVALGRLAEAAEHFGAAAALLDAGGPGEIPDSDRLARLRARQGALEKDHARPG